MSLHKYALVALLGLGLGLYEAVTLTFLGGWWASLHPVLPLMVFLIVMERKNYALVCGACAGLAMDLFAVEFSGYALWRLLAIGLLLAFMAQTVLTNRSLYAAAALMAIGRLADWLWLWLTERLLSIWHAAAGLAPQWSAGLKILGADLVFTALLFALGYSLFRRYFAPRQLRDKYG